MVILCVEDQVPTLHLLGVLCKEVTPGASVVLCAGVDEAVAALAAGEVEWVLTDLDFDGDKSLEVVVAAAAARVPCLVYSAHDGPAFVRAAFEAGATAFVSKYAPLRALRTALAAGHALTAQHGTCHVREVEEGVAAPLVGLTKQREQVLVYLIHGVSRQEISRKMRLSLNTVHSYIRDLCEVNDCKKEELIHRYLTWNRLK